MDLFLTPINVAVADVVYTATLTATKQWEGVTVLAGRVCLQSNSARGGQEQYIAVCGRYEACVAKVVDILTFTKGIFALWVYKLSDSRKGCTQGTEVNKYRH